MKLRRYKNREIEIYDNDAVNASFLIFRFIINTSSNFILL